MLSRKVTQKICFISVLGTGMALLTVKPASAVIVKGNPIIANPNGTMLKADFFFDAHPNQSSQDSGIISVNNQQLTLHSNFDPDKHGSLAASRIDYNVTGQGAGGQLLFVSSQAQAGLVPNCPEEDNDCGNIFLRTRGDGGFDFTITADENNPDEPTKILPGGTPSITLFSGTELSLGESGGFSSYIEFNGSSTLVYDLDFSVVLEDNPEESGDPFVRDQKVIASFVSGIDTSYFSFAFTNSKETIENNIINAFDYDSINNTWKVDEDAAIFTHEIFALQDISSATLNSSLSANSSDVEPVPEPLTILGSATALGFGALLKRRNSKNKNKS